MSEPLDIKKKRDTVPPPRQEPIPEGRSPVLAGILSAILPGAGHVYLGLVSRGLSYFGLAVMMVLLIWWTSTTHEFVVPKLLVPVLIVLLAVFYVWVIFSAVMRASRRTISPALALVIVLGFTYILGWQATEVNLVKFFTEFSDTFRIFTAVMWPWRAAFERELDVDIARTPFAHPCSDEQAPPEQVEGDGSQPWVVVDPACGEFAVYDLESRSVLPGSTLTVRGGGFQPEIEIQIWWKDPIGQEFRPLDQGSTIVVMPDENGDFEVTFGAPQYLTPAAAVGVNVHQVQARQIVAEGPLLLSDDLNLAVGRMIVTIFQALMATTLGIVLAVPFSFLAARNLMWSSVPTRIIYYAVRFVLNITRSIEPIIWAVIAAVWVGLGPFAGVIALTVHTIAALGKLYSEAIESIDPGPIEAVTATGANRLQTIIYAIVPQIIPPFLSFTIYRWDINVRMSTIIGFVGGGGIGQILFQWINQSRWSSAGMAVWLIAITVSVMDYASAQLRERFV